MKAIVTADIHIRVKPDVPEDWQLNRYRMLWDKYIDLCKEHGAKHLIIAGDVFDNHRISSKEGMLFVELVTKVSESDITTWIIDGNHDYSDPLVTTLDHFVPLFDYINENACGENTGKSFVHYRKAATAEFGNGDVCVSFVGHSVLKAPNDVYTRADATNILISHFRPNVNEFIKEEIDVHSFISGYDLCVAGDIHTDLVLERDQLVYTNSPLNSHFESNPNCGCLLLSADADGIEWERIPLTLPNYVQITTTADKFKEPKDAVNFIRIEVSGTPEELRKISTDKPNVKLVKVPLVSETYTEVEEEIKDQSLEEDLIDYMKELDYTEEHIAKLITVFKES